MFSPFSSVIKSLSCCYMECLELFGKSLRILFKLLFFISFLFNLIDSIFFKRRKMSTHYTAILYSICSFVILEKFVIVIKLFRKMKLLFVLRVLENFINTSIQNKNKIKRVVTWSITCIFHCQSMDQL